MIAFIVLAIEISFIIKIAHAWYKHDIKNEIDGKWNRV